MNILILGGTRLIGKRLVNRLIDSGAEVTIATRGRMKDSFGDRVNRVKLDLMIPDSVKENLPREHFDLVYDMMVLCPDHIRERLSIIDSDRYLMVSSAGVYYKNHHLGILETEFDAKAENWEYCGYAGVDYDTRKRFSEAALINDFEDVPSVRVRFPVVVSPDEYTGRFAWYVKHVANGEPMIINNYSERHAYISSVDAGDFLFLLSDNNEKINNFFDRRMAINAAGDGIISQQEICDIISSIVGKKPIVYNKNEDCVSADAPFDNTKEYSLDTELARSIGALFSDNSYILKEAITEIASKF